MRVNALRKPSAPSARLAPPRPTPTAPTTHSTLVRHAVSLALLVRVDRSLLCIRSFAQSEHNKRLTNLRNEARRLEQALRAGMCTLCTANIVCTYVSVTPACLVQRIADWSRRATCLPAPLNQRCANKRTSVSGSMVNANGTRACAAGRRFGAARARAGRSAQRTRRRHSQRRALRGPFALCRRCLFVAQPHCSKRSKRPKCHSHQSRLLVHSVLYLFCLFVSS
jgi:hypothetical protein